MAVCTSTQSSGPGVLAAKPARQQRPLPFQNYTAPLRSALNHPRASPLPIPFNGPVPPSPALPPPLQILVELAELQDQEVGDGTTSVVIVAAELLKRANELVRAKIHPTSIISGYRLAMREVGAAPAARGSAALLLVVSAGRWVG